MDFEGLVESVFGDPVFGSGGIVALEGDNDLASFLKRTGCDFNNFFSGGESNDAGGLIANRNIGKGGTSGSSYFDHWVIEASFDYKGRVGG